MSKKPQKLFALPILFALSACANGSTAPVVVSDYCRIAAPIFFDGDHDTPATLKQIEEHNSKWACVCEKDCPKP